MLNYILNVYKQDRRTKAGERLIGTYEYNGVSGTWMAEEVSHLRCTTHKPSDGIRLEWHPATVWVTNLQTGKLNEIPYADAGTHMDPSQERYWSM